MLRRQLAAREASFRKKARSTAQRGNCASPVLAMRHALAAARSTQQVIWLYAARDRQHHPFAAEVRRLMLKLPHGRSYVGYSRPGIRDKMGEDFDAAGHLSRSAFDKVGVPRDADVYLCGPNRFVADMKEALAAAGGRRNGFTSKSSRPASP